MNEVRGKARKIKLSISEYDHPCKIKGCKNKKRNGRCSLGAIWFANNQATGIDYSKCLSFESKE